MNQHYYLIAHREPLYGETLAEATVVATVTIDPRFMRNLNPHQHLTTLANKMGLIDFEITTADARDLPGHQLGLPFPRQRGHR